MTKYAESKKDCVCLMTVGSRAQVWHGTAKHTSGGLKKSDLIKNASGHIVSKKKHMTAKREKRLEKHGYFANKGKFGFVKKTAKKSAKKSGKKGAKKSAKK